MTGDFALMVGGFVSCFAIGWCLGRTVKTIRQFFDSI